MENRIASLFGVSLRKLKNLLPPKHATPADNFSLVIEKQYFNQGETFFKIKELHSQVSFVINAKRLYQNYDFLVSLSKKDMVTVIATAVQELTFLDLKKMGIL